MVGNNNNLINKKMKVEEIIIEIENLTSDEKEELFNWFQSKILVGGALVDAE